jgi:hypothetical protein
VLVFIQVPSAERILREAAFWDVYYEHCSYFTGAALSGLFDRHGMAFVDRWTDYDDQYLMLVARARGERRRGPAVRSEEWTEEVATFATRCAERVERWRRVLLADSECGRLAVWGAGSKAVAFVHALGLREELACLVDVNPLKHGTFLAASGHPIVAPERLLDVRPDTVVVMNPVYVSEIDGELGRLGLRPRILALDG